MDLPATPHASTVEEVRDRLSTGPSGISESEAETRLEIFGKNTLSEEKTSRIVIFLRQFNSILVYILIIAAIVALLISDIKDFIIIVFITMVNSTIGFFEEIKAEASLASLKRLTESRVSVIRGGERKTVPSDVLVPGDYVLLSEGDLVTADVRLAETSSLSVDESSLTGESLPVIKDHSAVVAQDAPPYDLKNSLLSGTSIVRGTGRGYVVATGKRTYFAGIADLARERSPDSPLTRAINHFSRRYIVLLVAIFSLILAVSLLQGRALGDIAYLLVAQMVSAVPAGLPIVVTIITVIGALALSKHKTLVRYLPAVETMGSATVIASDKTGTITEGRLTVHENFAIDPDELIKAAALCNDAHDGSGDPIDVALARWVEGYDRIREQNPRRWEYPFDTARRLMATAHMTEGGERFYIKGAYEELKKHAENAGGLGELERQIEAMAGRGLRVLAFGAGKWIAKDPASWRFSIVGIVGFIDPPKESAAEAVRVAKKAGIRVIMITGDHPLTAREIARSVHIWEEGDGLLAGPAIEAMSDDELATALRHTTVLARILPEHKYRIVKILQERKEIVTVTGDGVNDVPALRAADLGIAMGSGSEAAKSAAKMVIVDNNLAVIVDAIRNARVIVDNIRKAIYYLLSTSIAEIVLISSTVFAGLPLPLLPIQILWINLVTDGVQDKTFPFIREEGDVMARPPKDPAKQFFDRRQIRRIVTFGLVTGILGCVMFWYLLGRYPYELTVSIMFTSFVCLQWFNGLQAQLEYEPYFRNIRRSLTINPYIFVGIGLGIVLQLVAIYLVPGLFGIVPLALEHWGFVIGMSLVPFAVVEAIKWLEYLLAHRNPAS
ncbi:cation-transporting P-type ATPase [Methanoregula sp.]|uniref:cation-translocating P-type ATPase n=1 Tax=Methanoregula sp. TaxID=2052170 RepID=UPI000CC75848|nr:cation-transporting P-type ATPase [Methanoregula sp.]PKG33937.1 MAG: cation transporter [Methanoregula sp.]